jgi:rubrerythrin
MDSELIILPRTASRRHNTFSRRGILVGGVMAGVAGALGIGGMRDGAIAATPSDMEHDTAILNAAIDLENQAIWAYTVAAGKLTNTQVGQTILALAQRNRADHIKHRDILSSVVKSFGKTPAPAKESYDLSSYIQAGEGNLDSDANIAKLALALEVDAVLAYGDAFSKLKIADLLAAAGTIAPNESAHATAIRGVFKTLMPAIEYVPSAFINADTRHEWILKI